VSEWSDMFRELPQESSPEPGPWRTDRTPYLREVMDMLSVSNTIEEVVVMKGAQLGFTEAGCNWMGYVIDVAPGSFLAVQPTRETMIRHSRTRIEPLINSTPRLLKKIAPARSRDSGNTLLQKEFPGGILILAGANSAAGLRSMPIRFLFLDEVDAYPLDLDGEGNPIDLAKARTRNFSRRKIYTISTPTVEGQSAIAAEFETTDQRYFFVPCPHCDTFQILEFKNLNWEKGKPETVKYFCPHCAAAIEERQKAEMLRRGEWRATKPENISAVRVGYHISSLYSPPGWFSWADVAQEWEKAQSSVLKLKTFVNTVLAEVWREAGEVPAWEVLYSRRESYEMGSVPLGVCFITAGADVQRDRIEVEIVGWGKGKESWSVDYRVILGDTAAVETWNKLALVLEETFKRSDGLEMKIVTMAVDSGYNTQHVYDFCKRFMAPRVIAIKGNDNLNVIITTPRAVTIATSGKKIKAGVKVWQVGVSVVKMELYGWLKQLEREDKSYPPGFCHFPQYDQQYFRGITAEKHQYTKTPKGFSRYQWIKFYDRNEPLDCRVYARAAATVIGIDRMTDERFDAMAGVSSSRKVNVKKKSRDGKGGFWNKGE
jgi:phage terminase large subunit GpA-like protein